MLSRFMFVANFALLVAILPLHSAGDPLFIQVQYVDQEASSSFAFPAEEENCVFDFVNGNQNFALRCSRTILPSDQGQIIEAWVTDIDRKTHFAGGFKLSGQSTITLSCRPDNNYVLFIPKDSIDIYHFDKNDCQQTGSPPIITTDNISVSHFFRRNAKEPCSSITLNPKNTECNVELEECSGSHNALSLTAKRQELLFSLLPILTLTLRKQTAEEIVEVDSSSIIPIIAPDQDEVQVGVFVQGERLWYRDDALVKALLH